MNKLFNFIILLYFGILIIYIYNKYPHIIIKKQTHSDILKFKCDSMKIIY